MSGRVSTARRRTSGSIGTPIAMQIGPIALMKLIEPGRLIEPRVVVAATATPAAICIGVSSIPNQWAT